MERIKYKKIKSDIAAQSWDNTRVLVVVHCFRGLRCCLRSLAVELSNKPVTST